MAALFIAYPDELFYKLQFGFIAFRINGAPFVVIQHFPRFCVFHASTFSLQLQFQRLPRFNIFASTTFSLSRFNTLPRFNIFHASFSTLSTLFSWSFNIFHASVESTSHIFVWKIAFVLHHIKKIPKSARYFFLIG